MRAEAPATIRWSPGDPDARADVYGIAHEVAHLGLWNVMGTPTALPVVWDEAVAHVVAIDVLLPTALDADLSWPGLASSVSAR